MMLNKKNRYGGPNWAMIGIMMSGMWIWYAIFTIGFFTTMMWTIVGACIGAIYFKLKEMRW